MRQTQDDTMGRWITAADTLAPETQRECIAALARHARHADDEGDLISGVMLAVAAGHTPEVAARVAVMRAAQNRSNRDGARPASTDVAGWDDGERVAVSPSAESVALGGEAATCDGPTYEDVAPTLTKGARVILSALIADHMSRPGAIASLATADRKPLRVKVVAGALGQPAPRKAAQSALLRAAACRAWAEASVAMGSRVPVATRPADRPATPYAPTPHAGSVTYPNRAEWEHAAWEARTAPHAPIPLGPWALSLFRSETVEERTARALAYVTRPTARRAPMSCPVNVGSVWVKGQPNGIRFTAPQPDARWVDGVLTYAPARSLAYFPPAPVKHMPNPRPTDGVAEGLAWGGAGAFGLPDREVKPALTGLRWVREDKRQASAYTGRAKSDRSGWVDGMAQMLRCHRPALMGDSEVAARLATCGCGARVRGTALIDGMHPLTPCPAPKGERCGCSRKAGALILQHGKGCHAPKSVKAAHASSAHAVGMGDDILTAETRRAAQRKSNDAARAALAASAAKAREDIAALLLLPRVR